MHLNDPAIQFLLWEAGLQFLAILLAGLILGLFASVHLKKLDDVTLHHEYMNYLHGSPRFLPYTAFNADNEI